jgi:ferredoxin
MLNKQYWKKEAETIEIWTSFFAQPTYGSTPENNKALEMLRANLIKISSPESADQMLMYLWDNNIANSLVCEAINQLNRVYEAKNRFEVALFKDSDASQKDRVKQAQEKGKYLIQNRELEKEILKRYFAYPHDFIIVEKEEENGKYEVEYASICDLVDYESEGDVITKISFQEGDEVYEYDEVNYTKYKKVNNELVIVESFPHGLKNCPVRCITWERLRQNNEYLRTSPLVQTLGLLKMYLYRYMTSEKSHDSEVYKIVIAPERNCDFDSGAEKCIGGVLYRESTDNGWIKTQHKCPKCNISTAPGTLITYEYPKNGESFPKDIVQFVGGDADTLKFQDEKVEKLASIIWAKLVGENKGVSYTQAQNKDQISAGFESEISTLQHLKGVLEPALKWIYETVYKAEFGDFFVSYELNLGDDYYMFSAADLENKFAEQKLAGAPQTIQLETLKQIIDTKYRTNPSQRILEQNKLLIEPFPTLSVGEVFQMFQAGVITKNDLLIKANFNKFAEKYKAELVMATPDNISEVLTKIEQDAERNAVRELGQG